MTTTAESIKMQIAELQDLILQAHPRMPVLLQDIHKILKADPDNVTLLTEDEIGVITTGLMKHTQVEISTSALKTAKKRKDITLEDL